MLKLFYDTETTGLPDFKAPSDAPHQPHLVQLAAQLVDMRTRQVVHSLELIVQPNGWEIPDEVAKIHGITDAYARAVGVPEHFAIDALLTLWNRHLRIAHNEAFDARMIRIALKRYFGEKLADEWKAGAAECTCNLATPIVNLPPTEKMVRAGLTKAKRATLQEAHVLLLGHEFDGAHSAMNDVNACKAVYFALQDRANGTAP